LTVSEWFQGEGEIGTNLEGVKRAVENHGDLYVGVVSLMPGLTSVELVEQGADFVTIRTNEGLMERTNISKRIEPERMVVEFDEKYEAGSKVTVTSHFSDEFTPSGGGENHRLVVCREQTIAPQPADSKKAWTSCFRHRRR
jgi:hypothetical protein